MKGGWFMKKVMRRGARVVVEDVDLAVWLEKVWGSVWLLGVGESRLTPLRAGCERPCEHGLYAVGSH